MIKTTKELWEYFDLNTREYMAIRYYKTTRCMLTPEQIEHICLEELKVLRDVGSLS